MEFNLVQTIAIYALPVIFAITLHEAAHGYVARHFGDDTAFMLGRVSLNPLRHIDMVGTIAVPLLILTVSKLFGGAGILFGGQARAVNFTRCSRPQARPAVGRRGRTAAKLVMAIGGRCDEGGASASAKHVFPADDADGEAGSRQIVLMRAQPAAIRP